MKINWTRIWYAVVFVLFFLFMFGVLVCRADEEHYIFITDHLTRMSIKNDYLCIETFKNEGIDITTGGAKYITTGEYKVKLENDDKEAR